MLNPTRLIKLPLKKKITYNIVRKSLINFKWRLVGEPMLKKVIDIKTKSHWLFKFQSKNTPRKLKTFSFFCGNFFCSVFWYCTIVLKMRMHSGKFRQISQSARIFFNWMESGFWLKLIENITVEIPNTASISKDILFHVSEFLEKIVFQLMFEIIKWISNCSKLLVSDTINFFEQNTCFSFKTEVLVFAWFWPEGRFP